VLARCDETMLADELQCQGVTLEALNARQAFNLLKANTGEVVMPTPYRCYRDAPHDINVFTDGSWLFPLRQYLGLGGAGVWWPKRTIGTPGFDGDLYRVPLSIAESEIAHFRQESGGLTLYASIGGFSGSSTRTELAAGIIAACAHGPVHIGSDSEVFVNSANAIINDVLHRRKCKCSWKLVSDGDLWGHFYNIVVCKGPRSIKLTWVRSRNTKRHCCWLDDLN